MAVHTCKNICDGYREDAFSKPTVRRWFAKFQAGDFSLEKLWKPVSGRWQFDINPKLTTREFAELLNILKNIVHEYLVKLGYIFSLWYLGTTQPVREKLQELVFTQTQQNRTVFKKNGDRRWETDWLRQRSAETILPNNEKRRSWIFMQKILCSVPGGISKAFFTISCLHTSCDQFGWVLQPVGKTARIHSAEEATNTEQKGCCMLPWGFCGLLVTSLAMCRGIRPRRS